MSKRQALYSSLLVAALALAAYGSVKLGAGQSDRSGGGWPGGEATRQTNPATGPHAGDRWIDFVQTTFVSTQGDLVTAGLVYVAQGPKQAARQPIVSKAYVGIMYRIIVPGWTSILHGATGSTFVVDVHVRRWVEVLQTGVAGQEQ